MFTNALAGAIDAAHPKQLDGRRLRETVEASQYRTRKSPPA
jgi:hypothetical protein